MSKISKKMLINVVHPEEARVAIVHDGRLMELNIEITGKEQTKGNIYKGVVLRVEPGLQAAFVDVGRAKPGFLQMGELHPEQWQWRDDVPKDQRSRRPRIQEVLRRGQELLVQVEKDERDTKGCALTTYLSLPGRYMVVMPGSDSTGISRKVEQEGVRRQLKEIVASMTIPEGIGYIIRTEAVGRTQEELQKDLDSLVAQLEDIKAAAAEIKGAGEVYRDKGLIIRFLRDYFSDDIDEVLVDSKEAYKEAKEFFRENMPTCEKLVKLHKEKRPIFSRFQLEEQIDQIYEKRVNLPSGGSLIIEPTEALVSIDVNSGKSTGERGVEDTAFRTNTEAAEEVARQLRLRDLGGLIVIDFIDMRDRKHNHDVEKTLKQALKMDKARVNLGRISDFGLLEMSRQRIAKTLNDAIHLGCPHCEGRGKVKSVEAMALSFLRKVHAAAAKGNIAEVHGGLPLEVAYYLLNRKKRELTQIENDYDIQVTVKGKTSFLLNQVELDVVKREKLEVPPEAVDAGVTPVAAEVRLELGEPVVPSTEPASAEGGKKKKRRRKKKKGGAEAGMAAPAEGMEHGAVAEVSAEPSAPPVSEGEAAEVPAGKKKRRRRKKRGAGEAGTPAEEATAVVEAPEEPVHEAGPEEGEPEHEGKGRKRRRKRGRKGAKAGEEQQVIPAEPAAPVVPVVEKQAPPAGAEEPAAEKPKRKRAPRAKKRAEGHLTAEAPLAEAPPAPEAAEPTAPKRKRAAKKAAPAEPAAELPAAEAVKKPARSRKKKTEPAGE